MDLGCIDMGCVEKQSNEISPQKESSSGSSSSDSVMATSKIGKNKGIKESGQSNWNALSKCTPQIKKPPRRKTSPLNWFPRRKVDSYLKRKIQLLQEVDGMNSTLDETLGDSNPHYSRVLKEKIAVKEAATKAMEARKAAMVEASWCRILKAASIDCKYAEAQLVGAEKVAAEAFEAATAIGVTMYDISDCSQRSCKVEFSATKGGGGAPTHTVSASFETAFEVDKQVAYAVKTAFTKLANCSSIKKDEFRELLRKISQNPDSDENSEDFSGISSECDSDAGSEHEMVLLGCQSYTQDKEASSDVRQTKFKKGQVSEKFNMAHLVELMLERLKGLQEDELASLATIVATCGLSAALARAESVKKHDSGCTTSTNQSGIPVPRRVSTSGAGSIRNFGMDGQRKMMDATELPSLDKFLVKKVTRLERVVLEAKKARDGDKQEIPELKNGSNLSVPGLGDVLVKHSSKLEKEVERARKNSVCSTTHNKMQNMGGNYPNQDVTQLPSLDKFLVKHVSRLEREVQEARNRRNFEQYDGTESRKATTCLSSNTSGDQHSVGKENIYLNQNVESNLDLNRSKPSSNTAKALPNDGASDGINDPGTAEFESLDKILVKHVSRLERDKMEFLAREEGTAASVRRRETKKEVEKKGFGEKGLDQVLIKHKSRLEREKMAAAAAKPSEENEVMHSVARREARQKEFQEAWGGISLGNSMHHPHFSCKLERGKMTAAASSAQPSEEDPVMLSVSRREARQKELQDSWGGLSLGNSMRPHFSRLQRDKAAWLKAEEEERKRGLEIS